MVWELSHAFVCVASFALLQAAANGAIGSQYGPATADFSLWPWPVAVCVGFNVIATLVVAGRVVCSGYRHL